MLKSVIAAIVVLAGTMLAPTLGVACEGGKVLLEDKFTKLSPAWGFSLDPKTEKVDAGGYTVDFPPNNYRRGLNQAGYFDNNYVACATFVMNFVCSDPAKCENQGYLGLVVLGADSKNFYTFDLSPPFGTYSVFRVQNDKWLTPVPWTAIPDTKFKPGDKIELQATVQGGNMKFKVNGKDVVEFDGIAPDGGSLVGFELASMQADTKNTQFSLSNFTVKELPK